MKLTEILNQIGDQTFPPVETWNPEYCGEINIEILRDGRWLHEGDEIKRERMVKLFASILKREGDDYFLITPVEKMKIKVEQTPFVVVSAELIDGSWVMCSNLGEKGLLTDSSSLSGVESDNPEIIWRSNLPARIHRNVMYQWQMHALDHRGLKEDTLFLESSGANIPIGYL